jgi:hypothetical protein
MLRERQNWWEMQANVIREFDAQLSSIYFYIFIFPAAGPRPAAPSSGDPQ